MFFLVVFCFLLSCNSNIRQSLTLPENLAAFNENQQGEMKDMMSKKYKVVAFFRSEYTIRHDIEIYSQYVDAYPEIGFIFYVTPVKNIDPEKFFLEKKFAFPAFLDVSDDFISSNPYILPDITFMSFIINQNNEIISELNPSIPNYDEILKKLSGKIDLFEIQ